MLAKGHVAVGITAYTTSVGLLSIVNPLSSIGLLSFGLGLGATALGSVLPDIDTPDSVIGRKCTSISRWLSSRFEHRTVTHSAVFSISWFIFAAIMGSPTLWALAWAIFGHILVDSFSWQGVLWKYPFQKWHSYKSGGQYKKGRPYHKGYQVGGRFESMVYNACWVYLSVLMIIAPFLLVFIRESS